MTNSYAQRRIRRNSGMSGSSRCPFQRCKFFLRKSLSVIGKLPVIVKQRIRGSVRKFQERDAGHVTFSTKLTLGQYKQSVRKSEACIFRHKYIYDCSIDKRVYINSSGDTYSWLDRSVGCMWVGVQGMKRMCVAFRGTLDPAHYPGYSPNMFRRLFSLNVISEIEDIAMSSSDSHQTLDELAKKPFGVVSMIQSTTDVQESSDEASGALKYLKERFECEMDLITCTETIQTAISALQRDCNQEFKANDIWVCVLDEENEYHLQREELEEHLAVINKQPLQTDEINESHLSASKE